MDDQGRIYKKPAHVTAEQWAKKCEELGLTAIAAEDLPALRGMNRHQRRAFISKMRRGVH